MIKWKLNEIIGTCRDEGDPINLSIVERKTKISYSTLHRISSNKATRVDLGTLDTLIAYFNNEFGAGIVVGDLLEWESDGEAE